MAQLDLIAPPKTVTVTFSLAPAYNVIASLSLFDWTEKLTGLSEWVYETERSLSPQQRRANKLVLQDAPLYLGDAPWPSFPAWVDHLAAREPASMRDQSLQALRTRARRAAGGAVPDAAELLADRAAYLALVERMPAHSTETRDLSIWEEMHGLLNDPAALQSLIVTHLRTMWELVAPEWERYLPMLSESVAAFESLGLTGLTAVEALRKVALRDIQPEWPVPWLSNAEHIVFIPSAHAGPYILRLGGISETTERIAFGARLPADVPSAGRGLHSLALSRSELLMRLNALANDTRLRILELLGREGELNTSDIMARLALSQSAAWRHLEHLTATGYLTMRTLKGAKCYRLNPERIDHTFQALKAFCQ